MSVFPISQLSIFYDPNVKVDYIYGLTDPRLDSADLYEVIRGYVIDKGLNDGIEIEAHYDYRFWSAFFRKIETLSGFPARKLDMEAVWVPDSMKHACVIVLARDKAPEDQELIDKMKRAIIHIKVELKIEGDAKWYVGDHEEFDEVSFPETGKFDTPPCFT